MVQIIISKKDN